MTDRQICGQSTHLMELIHEPIRPFMHVVVLIGQQLQPLKQRDFIFPISFFNGMSSDIRERCVALPKSGLCNCLSSHTFRRMTSLRLQAGVSLVQPSWPQWVSCDNLSAGSSVSSSFARQRVTFWCQFAVWGVCSGTVCALPANVLPLILGWSFPPLWDPWGRAHK